MKTTQKIIVGFLAASATFLGVAYAKGPGCDGDGPMRGAMMRDGESGRMSAERMGKRMDQRLERLHRELKISAQQEPLWQAFTEKSKAEIGKGVQSMRDGADAKLTAPERMEKMQANMKERVAGMESVNESFKRLYAALTPEQKAAADKHFSRIGAGGHRGPQGGPQGNGPNARPADAGKG